MVFFAEAYFAGLVREVLYDAQGKPIGPIVDLIIEPRERYPVVTKVVVQPPHTRDRLVLPWHLIRSASYEGFQLSGRLEHLRGQRQGPHPGPPDRGRLRPAGGARQ
jgi:hypothetical protein